MALGSKKVRKTNIFAGISLYNLCFNFCGLHQMLHFGIFGQNTVHLKVSKKFISKYDHKMLVKSSPGVNPTKLFFFVN